MENEAEKKENKLEERKINSETEMDKTSEGNEVGEVERKERVKEKKRKRPHTKTFIGEENEKKSRQDIFSDKAVTPLGRKLEKQYSI